MEENIIPPKLLKSMMGFKLEDGSMIFIHENDVEKIAQSVSISALVMINAEVEKTIMSKEREINLLQGIINSNKEMSQETKDEYYKKMLEIFNK